jgi:putative membrane protein
LPGLSGELETEAPKGTEQTVLTEPDPTTGEPSHSGATPLPTETSPTAPRAAASATAAQDTPSATTTEPPNPDAAKIPYFRTGIAGVLMGLANLVPGVSGGTMVLVMGLYDRFVGALADLTRFRFTRRAVLFVAVLGGIAAVTIAGLSGPMSKLVSMHRAAMFSLFIGMTLGGTPVLLRMIRPARPAAAGGALLGLALMIALGPPPERPEYKNEAGEVDVVVEANYGRDVAAGVLGMSAMVLPGISGAHMLLIIGRYEPILAAVSMTKDYVVSGGSEGDPAVFLQVMIPVGIGAVLSLVVLSNLLKWLLARYPQPMVGFLIGILWGAVYSLWPFRGGPAIGTVVIGCILAVAGFGLTIGLSRLSR